MKRRLNLTGLCLLATFFLIFGSILSIPFFTAGTDQPVVSADTAAKPSGN